MYGVFLLTYAFAHTVIHSHIMIYTIGHILFQDSLEENGGTPIELHSTKFDPFYHH